jgi:hypothetical protein
MKDDDTRLTCFTFSELWDGLQESEMPDCVMDIGIRDDHTQFDDAESVHRTECISGCAIGATSQGRGDDE